MHINRKITITAALFAVMALSIAASLPQAPPPPKPVNLKVLPKHISNQMVHKIMDAWSASLGVRCNFCHERDAQTNKMDFASDAKPEKQAARDMFKMMSKINSKYFNAKKDSLGMVMTSGINCYTCHRGASHPDVKLPEEHKGPGGPPPGAPGTPPGK